MPELLIKELWVNIGDKGDQDNRKQQLDPDLENEEREKDCFVSSLDFVNRFRWTPWTPWAFKEGSYSPWINPVFAPDQGPSSETNFRSKPYFVIGCLRPLGIINTVLLVKTVQPPRSLIADWMILSPELDSCAVIS